MKIKIVKQIDDNIQDNEIKVVIKSNKETEKVKEIIKHIENLNNDKILVHKGYEGFFINYKDILLFYSENKNNYCRTKKEVYQVKNKLYELENIEDFIRISKKCIVNINMVKCFDMSKTGKITVVLNDGTEENVSRRRIGNLLKYLESRSIWWERGY